ncbi:MAG: PD-(D/E)XK nuclease family protein [Actinobacteria bacterium]|nr:PD-(D/E)XK nuclease family protein [Actinomycetota bacterium]MCL5446979.1 PD-(D/E)XK nuclease family protein [Actinomycetota bacterium]
MMPDLYKASSRSGGNSEEFAGDEANAVKSSLLQLRSDIERLVGSISDLVGGDPFEEVHLVVPSVGCRRWIERHMAARGGYAGVSIVTPDQLVLKAGVKYFYGNPDHWGKTKLGEETIDLIVRYAIPGLTDASTIHAGGEPSKPMDRRTGDYRAAGTLVDIFNQLPVVDTALLEQCSSVPDVTGRLCRLVRDLRELLHKYDIALDSDIIAAYREWKESADAGEVKDCLGHVVAYCLPSDDVMSDLVRSLPGVEVLTSETVHSKHGQAQHSGCALAMVISCADMEAEIRTIVRAVLRELRRGVAPGELCILYSSAKSYRRLFAQYLRHAGIPCSAGETISLLGLPATGLLLDLVRAVSNGWDRKGLARFASRLGVMLQTDNATARAGSSDRDHLLVHALMTAERLSILAKVSGGSDGWVKGLEQLAKDTSRVQDAQSARVLARFLQGLFARCGYPDDTDWHGMTKWCVDILDTVVNPLVMGGKMRDGWLERSGPSSATAKSGGETATPAGWTAGVAVGASVGTSAGAEGELEEMRNVLERIDELHFISRNPSPDHEHPFGSGYTGRVSLPEFLSLLELELSTVHRNVDGGSAGVDGVFLGKVGQGRGMLFHKVFVAGLTGSLFPPPPPPISNLISNACRSTIGLDDDQSYITRTRQDLELAILSAQQGAVGTFHRRDGSSGDEQVRSPWLSSYMDGSTVTMESSSFIGDLASLTDNDPYLDRTELALHAALAPIAFRDFPDSMAFTSTSTDDLSHVQSRESDSPSPFPTSTPTGQSRLSTEIFDDARLRLGMQLVAGRSSPLLTPFDGVLDPGCVRLPGSARLPATDAPESEDAAASHDATSADDNHFGIAGLDAANFGIAALPSPPAVSATRLEAYASCPRRYLFEHELALRSVLPPEELLTIEAKDKGTLVHRILETYVRQRLTGLPRGRNTLMDVAERILDDVPRGMQTGNPFFWQRERKGIIEMMERFADEEEGFEVAEGVSPVAAEFSFGMGDPDGGTPYNYRAGSTGNPRYLRLRGKMDRLDLSADRSRVIITDYKTGRQDGLRNLEKDPVDRGKRLQLAFYGQVAAEAIRLMASGYGLDDVEERDATSKDSKDSEDADLPDSGFARTSSGPDGSIRFPDDPPAGGRRVPLEVVAQYWLLSEGRSAARYRLVFNELARGRFHEAIRLIISAIEEGTFVAVPGKVQTHLSSLAFENCSSCAVTALCHPGRGRTWKKKLPMLRQAGSSFVELIEGEPAEELKGITKRIGG